MRENVKNATVDGMLQYMIGFEPFMLVLQGEVLQASCAPGTDGSRPVFVDSGANEGLWSVLAGSLGCHVISVEPQPTCIEWIKQSLALNPLAERHVHIWHHFLGVDANATLSVDADACTGSQQILVQPQANRSSALMVQPKANQSANRSYALAMNAVALARARTRVNVTAARLDASAYLRSTSPASHIALWHLDTEGAEVFVLRSAAALFEHERIDRIVLEVTPHKWADYSLGLAQGYAELAARFENWQCIWACTGHRIEWSHEFARVSALLRHGSNKDHGGHCLPPWNRVASAVDAYCVRRSVDPIFSPHLFNATT